MSDILRVLILEKLGGTYFDFDTISRKEAPHNLTNFVVAGITENWKQIYKQMFF